MEIGGVGAGYLIQWNSRILVIQEKTMRISFRQKLAFDAELLELYVRRPDDAHWLVQCCVVRFADGSKGHCVRTSDVKNPEPAEWVVFEAFDDCNRAMFNFGIPECFDKSTHTLHDDMARVVDHCLREWLDSPIDLGVEKETAQMTLMEASIAVRDDCLDTIKTYCQTGANLDKTDEYGNTLLHYCAMLDRPQIAKYLIENGASLNPIDSKGNTPLHLAANHGGYGTCRILINNGVNVNSTNRGQVSPLMSAAGRGHSDLLKMLIEAGGEVNFVGPKGITALHLAAHGGQREITEILLSAGASNEAKEENGYTPSELARAHGHPEVALKIEKKKKKGLFGFFG
jgi:hypothetical protein